MSKPDKSLERERADERLQGLGEVRVGRTADGSKVSFGSDEIFWNYIVETVAQPRGPGHTAL